jgi:hypothetical protein
LRGAHATTTNPNMQSNGKTSKKQQSKQVTKRQASLMETLTISQAGQEEIRRQAKAKKQEPLPMNQRSSMSCHLRHHQDWGGGSRLRTGTQPRLRFRPSWQKARQTRLNKQSLSLPQRTDREIVAIQKTQTATCTKLPMSTWLCRRLCKVHVRKQLNCLGSNIAP